MNQGLPLEFSEAKANLWIGCHIILLVPSRSSFQKLLSTFWDWMLTSHGIQKTVAVDSLSVLITWWGKGGGRPWCFGNQEDGSVKDEALTQPARELLLYTELHPFFHVSTAKITVSPTLFTIKRLQIRITFITLASFLGCSLLPDRGAVTPRKRGMLN